MLRAVKMRRQAAIMAAMCTLLVAACSSSGDDQATEASSTPPAAAASTDPAMASALAKAGIPPKPDQATQAAYLAALRAIDPAIVGDKEPDRVVGRGRDQCGSIADWPNDRAKLVGLVQQRFTAPGKSFDQATAERILDVVHQHLCPTYPLAKS